MKSWDKFFFAWTDRWYTSTEKVGRKDVMRYLSACVCVCVCAQDSPANVKVSDVEEKKTSLRKKISFFGLKFMSVCLLTLPRKELFFPRPRLRDYFCRKWWATRFRGICATTNQATWSTLDLAPLSSPSSALSTVVRFNINRILNLSNVRGVYLLV